MHNTTKSRLGTLLIWSLCLHGLVAAEWFVAPDGRPTGKGTSKSPWDIESAFGGDHKVAPGDTLWLAGGTYKYPPKVLGQGFTIKLFGTRKAPVHVRGLKGQRVTLDGGLVVQEPATYLWIWDLEIFVSEPRPEQPVPKDPTYRNVNRPWGGLTVNSGAGCKFINLVLHDNCQGSSWWSGSTDSELHGCLIYDNGWPGTDRGHGHAIYTQNREGTKTVSDCIMTGGFGYTLHAYGSSRAYVDNYLVERNIAYNAGRFLIGGGRPSHHIQVYSNCLYNAAMQLGYDTTTNEDCIVRGNMIVNGDLQVSNFIRPLVEQNLVLQPNSARPGGTQVFLYPNKYDPSRANLAIWNWEKKPAVAVDLSSFVRPGQQLRLMEPKNFYGPPAWSGKYPAGALQVTMTNEFAAWVLLKEL